MTSGRLVSGLLISFLSFTWTGFERTRLPSGGAYYLPHHTIARDFPCDEYFHSFGEYCPSAVYTYCVHLRSVLLYYSLIYHILIIPYLQTHCVHLQVQQYSRLHLLCSSETHCVHLHGQIRSCMAFSVQAYTRTLGSITLTNQYVWHGCIFLNGMQVVSGELQENWGATNNAKIYFR